MPLAKDLVEVGDEAEQAIRYGDTGPGVIVTSATSTQSGGTLVGGPTGYTLIEINASTLGSNTITFLATTEQDREYTVYNVATTASTSTISATQVNVFPPVGGNFNGLGTNVAFVIGPTKTATVTRLGPIPPFSTSTLTMGTIASDRWIYMLSA